MEHAFLIRVNNYLVENEIYPNTMLGFRAGLSTQDVMLQIKHQILDSKTRSTRAILGFDLKKAFDKAAHSAILSQVSHLNLGDRAYNYIRDFLTNRKATLTMGELKSEVRDMGSSGTPQGSVISPMLFNLIMIGLPEKLEDIEGINHSLYADDITIWISQGSDGEIEQKLQEAVCKVEEYLTGTGLECSPEKSELLLYRPTLKGRPPKGYIKEREYEEIHIRTKNGGAIPIVEQIRVLGLNIESKGTNGETLRKLGTKVTNAIRLIRRITNNIRE